MTMVECIDCKGEYHIGSGAWVYTFEDLEDCSDEKGLCEDCYEKNRVAFIEKMLTKEQEKKLKKFSDMELERFMKAVKDRIVERKEPLNI